MAESEMAAVAGMGNERIGLSRYKRMAYCAVPTRLAPLVLAGGLLAAGCGDSESPTSPAPPVTQPPAPPPAPSVSRIEVSPDRVSLEPGRTQAFVATAKGSDGSVITGVNFTWSSNNAAVATINTAGLATATGIGTATIRANGNGILSAPGTITVVEPPVSMITLAPSSTQEIMTGATVRFTATARTAEGAVRDDIRVAWSSSDTSVVRISSAGVATAVRTGTAMVSATADGITSSSVTITVTDPTPPTPVVTRIDLNPSIASREVGETLRFTATAREADGSEITGVSFVWSSSNNAIAAVNDNGLATAVNAGSATIRATAEGVTGTASFTVTDPPPPPTQVVARIDISPGNASREAGQTLRFTATARDADGSEITGVDFIWSSNRTGVATVNADGLATAVSAGSAIIRATAEGVSGTASLTVTEPPPLPPVIARIDISPSTASREVGQTLRFTATARESDGSTISGVDFIWTSNRTGVATVNADGLATAVSAGSAIIRATAEGVTGSASLTVTEPPPTVATIEVSPGSASIEEGDTQQFNATATESDGSVITGVSFAWSSSNSAVATVNANGHATAVNAGSATIRATAEGITGTASLTVTEPPPTVATIEVNPSTASIEEGDSQQFNATAREADGSEITGVSFNWSSSNSAVATINAGGLATAVSAGSATIRAAAEGVTGTASLTVTEPPPPPALRSRTGSISGRGGYNRSAGSVTLSETSDGKLRLVITGLNNGGAPNVWVALNSGEHISWWLSDPAPSGARGFSRILANDRSFTATFTPDAGENIDTYSHLILHCRAFNMEVGSTALSN